VTGGFAGMRAQKRILIVLEDVATLDRLGAHLSDQGFDIRYAGSPAEALALNHDWNADLVIATYESGQGNGVTERDIEKTLLDRLRSQYSGSRYLLIVALGQTPRNLRGMKDTVIAFLGSPFTPEDLMYYVRSALMNEPVGHANRREHARHTFNIESHCVLINPFNNTESRPMPLLMRDLSRSGFSMIVRQMLPVPAMIKIVISLSDQTHPLVMLAKTLTCTLTQIEKVYRVGARFVGLLPEQLDKVILQLNENGGAERDTDIYMGKSFKQAVEDWLTTPRRSARLRGKFAEHPAKTSNNSRQVPKRR
jgi:DNA-binding response OmpR family regulator